MLFFLFKLNKKYLSNLKMQIYMIHLQMHYLGKGTKNIQQSHLCITNIQKLQLEEILFTLDFYWKMQRKDICDMEVYGKQTRSIEA